MKIIIGICELFQQFAVMTSFFFCVMHLRLQNIKQLDKKKFYLHSMSMISEFYSERTLYIM